MVLRFQLISHPSPRWWNDWTSTRGNSLPAAGIHGCNLIAFLMAHLVPLANLLANLLAITQSWLRELKDLWRERKVEIIIILWWGTSCLICTRWIFYRRDLLIFGFASCSALTSSSDRTITRLIWCSLPFIAKRLMIFTILAGSIIIWEEDQPLFLDRGSKPKLIALLPLEWADTKVKGRKKVLLNEILDTRDCTWHECVRSWV